MRLSVRVMIGMLVLTLLGSIAFLPRTYAVAPTGEISTLELVGKLSGSVQAVAVDGGFAYMAGLKDLKSVFTVFSLTDPTLPVKRGSLELEGTAKLIKIQGARAYVASSQGLHIITIADPDQPTLVATYLDAGLDINDLQVINTTVYLASSSNFIILNVANPNAITQLGGDGSSWATSVWVAGTTAYVGTSGSGLKILDIANPASPVYLGGIGVIGPVNDIVVTGTTMYVAATYGVIKVDVSNPAQPVELARFDRGYNSMAFGLGLELVGSRLYVTERYWGVLIFGLAPGDALPLLGTYRTNGEGLGLAVAGNYVYIADGAVGMKIIDTAAMQTITAIGGFTTSRDIADLQQVGNLMYSLQNYTIDPTTERGSLVITNVANPQAPTLVGELELANPAWGIKVVGTTAYVANGLDGLKIIDVANPAAPTLIGSAPNTTPWPGGFSDVDVVNGLATVVGVSLMLYDVTNPAQPVLRGSLPGQGGTSVMVVGGRAYVGGGQIIRIVDISNPLAPALRSTLDMGAPAYDIDVVGSIAYVAVTYVGLVIVDVEQAAAPRLLKTFPTLGDAHGVRVENQRAYVTGTHHGLTIVDVSKPEQPYLLSITEGLGNTGRVDVSNGYVYVTAQDNRVVYLNANTLRAPVLRYTYKTQLSTWDVAFASDTVAYVAAGPVGLQIVDVTNPSQPQPVGSYDPRPNAPYGGARDTTLVKVVGNRAYVLDTLHGFDILDISNPLQPVRLGRADATYIDAMEIDGTRAYLSSLTFDTQIIEMANPAQPTRQTYADSAGDLDVVNGIAYIPTSGSNSLKIVDFTNLASPQLLGSYVNNSCGLRSVKVVGQIAYLGTHSCGLLVLDVSNPAAPVKIGEFASSSPINGLVERDGILYVANWGAGSLMLDISQPAAPTLLAQYTTTTSNAVHVEPRDGYVYVAEGYGGLYVLRYSETAFGEIGPAGGTLTSTMDTTSYQFAAGSFSETAIVTHTARFSWPDPGALYAIDHTFEITGTAKTTGLAIQPSLPFTVTVQYTQAQKAVAVEATLGLYAWNGSAWILEPSSVVDPVANTIVATPNRFGLFAVLGETHRIALPRVQR